LTEAQIRKTVTSFYKELESEHRDSEMCIVAVISTGNNGQLNSSDGNQINDTEILKLISSAPKLAGKPKLFLFAHTRYKHYNKVKTCD